MSSEILERRNLHQAIDTLTENALDKLADYIDFLRYEDRMEELEDAEDIAYIESLKPESYTNAVPWCEAVAKFEAEHGPLYKN